MTMIATIGKFLVGAAVIGGVAGYGSIITTSEGREQISAQFADMAEGAGQVVEEAGEMAAEISEVRERVPQPGDNWGGCNDARDAGTAPIYAGEPGYRSDMDGDNDGIACEPHY